MPKTNDASRAEPGILKNKSYLDTSTGEWKDIPDGPEGSDVHENP